MPPKRSKSKKGKGKVEPVDSEPAQEEVDKTTNVKPKNKINAMAFTEQQKEEIIDFLMLLIYQSRSHRGSIVIEITQNIHSTIVTHRNRAHQSLELVAERIGTYRVLTDRGHLSL